jgi:hypothetical protein
MVSSIVYPTEYGTYKDYLYLTRNRVKTYKCPKITSRTHVAQRLPVCGQTDDVVWIGTLVQSVSHVFPVPFSRNFFLARHFFSGRTVPLRESGKTRCAVVFYQQQQHE